MTLDWLLETLQLVFTGVGSLAVAAVRIALMSIAAVAIWLYVKALINNPVYIVRGPLGVVTLLVVGFGSILSLPEVIPLPTPIIWIIGWVAAYYISVFIGGWKDEK